MKAAEQLMARLGGNMAESMGPATGPALRPEAGPLHGEAQRYKGAARVKDALSIKLEHITPDPGQPRKEFDPDALADLAASLKARGQLQPIRVRWDQAAARWVIISGERRYRAALVAGLPSLVCIEEVRTLTDAEILEDQLVENCLRSDLKPIEQARAFKTLMDRRGWSYRQLGSALSLSSGHITRAMALLDLPGDLQERVESGELAPSVAYEVSRLGDAGRQREVAARVVGEGLSRTEAVEVVRRATGRGGSAKGRGAGKSKKATFRGAAGRVTVELRKGAGDEAISALLTEALDQVKARLGGAGQAAA
jgi:ParB family transcriptional regulator, chromosome partitioning protein